MIQFFVTRMSADISPMFTLLYKCLIQWGLSVSRVTASGSPESLSVSQFKRVPGCTNVLCSCVWFCCGADIVYLVEVAMTPADVASCVCLCWCYVHNVRVLTFQEETRSVTQLRKGDGKPIGAVWTTLIAVEPNLLLLYFHSAKQTLDNVQAVVKGSRAQ